MRRLRTRRSLVLAIVMLAVVAGNSPVIADFVSSKLHEIEIDRASYKANYGSWQTVELPEADRLDAVHTAVLQTGKLLIIAGSGNSQQLFDAGTFKTLLWDPATGQTKMIPTPSDFFCGGHAFLPNGNLLVAGGTARYEVLASKVEYAAGAMRIENRLPQARELAKGTIFVSPEGEFYRSDRAITLEPATRGFGKGGRPTVQATAEDVWVEALAKGQAGVLARRATYRIMGPGAEEASTLTAEGTKMTLEKQNFQGSSGAFEFNPVTERYDYVPPMAHKRWYPSLATEASGKIIAVSGLDGAGQIQPGATDVFDSASGTWSKGPFRYFPTYPALFLMNSGDLFFSGSSTGYGPADDGRQPGLWNLETDAFTPVPGLPDAEMAETSGSVLLPPAQSQKVMILGGGGVGTSPLVTARTAIADLSAAHPEYRRGPDLAEPTRYPLTVILPDDTVLVTGGARQYRGEHQSDNHLARIFHPDTNSFSFAAAPEIGRDYHSEAVLLPDGRVATMGSNPLYADKNDTTTAPFEQRIEIYSPPYLFLGPRPQITGGPVEVPRGGSATFSTSNPAEIEKIRLIHPSAATHDTDMQQRSIAIGFTRTPDGVRIEVPHGAGLVPLGWYMLFVDNAKGVPSVARWVKVT